jgi:ATP-dependent helicase/nuclease subunit A
MSRQVRVSFDVVAQQRQAADPASSVWVKANAGSGKTHVLTERVLRLLLSGVRPEEILCLTYTKAAAAEMRRRVSARLAEWSLLGDRDLTAALRHMEDRVPTPELTARARTLFAYALETPGGLKINTIHAFCESVLHRFPLEAGVPFDFAVIEEEDGRDMIRRTREQVLARGLSGDSPVAGAVDSLFELMSDFAITEAIEGALADRRKLRHVLADRAGAKARLRKLAKSPPGETRATVLAQVVEEALFPLERYPELFAHRPPDPAKTKNLNFVERLWQVHGRAADGAALFDAFLKEGGAPYKDRCTAKISDPSLADAIGAEHDRLAGLYPAFRRATLVERSEALLDVLGAITDRYEAEKRTRSLLDFDDLVEKLGDLFADPARADWVKYKLDAGITHILVDESQDTNPEQWRVVREIAREFFVGDSAISRPRTLFAVGDEKQSIYSFQGADPALFGQSGREFAASARQIGSSFADVPLHTSFRTLDGILNAVDLVFSAETLRTAVLSAVAPVQHFTARAETGGIVTLWPPIRQPDDETDAQNWPLTVPENVKAAPRELADRIAGEIAGWVKDRRPLGPRGRPVRADDVLILVQSRSALFFELIRALGQRGLPTPGADRLAVTAHIGVLDLLALGDVLLNPGDDLQLAALLRSPLFDIGEDDLFDLAHGRAGTLWQALESSKGPAAIKAFAQLRRWRGRLDFDRPFEFYAEILYGEGGLRRFHSRLGPEIFDVASEFLELALAHEQTPQPSLQGFLAEMRAREVSIKRELAETGNGVRVMTVHGAKGLESPIVILADATSQPQGRQTAKPVIIVPEAPGPLFVHASARKDHVPETLRLREVDEAAQQAEYWRKLYVGMTRAEDELYVTGVLTKTGRLEGTWYEAIERALGPESEILTDAAGASTLVYPRHRPTHPPLAISSAAAATAMLPRSLPPLAVPTPVPIVTPSSAFAGVDAERVFKTSAEGAIDAETARREGNALHALLQHLGRVPHLEWQKAVEKAMPVLLPGAPERHPALGRRAIAILEKPAFSRLFGPDSRAEVPFLANASRDGTPIRLAGRMDRILVDQGRVLVVDYKSDANPPRIVEDVPAPYVTQVGLYALVAGQLFPGLAVEAAILWTTLESLMILPTAALQNAVSAFTLQ